MGSSLENPSDAGAEKGAKVTDYDNNNGDVQTGAGFAFEQESYLTRNGLTLESFKQRRFDGAVELDRRMKPRHLQMIAIGGSIGAGFFVGSGKALYNGGPASVTIDFLIIGIMIFNVVFALGELAVMYPVSGGFYIYSSRFIDPSWGFAMGWNYVAQWAVVLPLELTVCAVCIQYWNEELSPGIFIAIFLVAIIFINIFGGIGYAEEEFWSSCLKLGAIVAFMIISLVLVCGGGPSNGRYNEFWGDRLWHEDPGAFKNGFKGFCSVFVTAAFSFAGTELVGLAAAESKNPTKALPGAIKQVFWRITLFYILGLFFVGLLVSAADDRLNISGYSNAKASPFVLVGEYSGLTGLNHFMNSIILVSVLSLGVSAVYGGSRTLTAMAEHGYAPKIFAYIDRGGRPTWSVLAHIVMGFLAFVNLDPKGGEIFDWLLALSGLSTLFTWGSICLAHIRFRKAWAHQGHTLDEIPFRAVGGVYGSWLGLFLIALVLIAQFYVAIVAPPGSSGMGTVEGFFMSYLALPVVLFFWAIGYIWKREGWLSVDKIDIDTGRREHDWDEINKFRAEMATWPAWRRFLHKIM
ncbi:Amino-acid permease inda1 [Fusarium duplospermum]|uniref:Amino-acid permease inda1 n=1 Tax=Fusarium duplospermum TaxID=1325734 RepID=A0A428QLS7_9HYPO|nr:Amino-acid permease inda1 [Fusarium duplospermum]